VADRLSLNDKVLAGEKVRIDLELLPEEPALMGVTSFAAPSTDPIPLFQKLLQPFTGSQGVYTPSSPPCTFADPPGNADRVDANREKSPDDSVDIYPRQACACTPGSCRRRRSRD
jgi:hypothetical protein